MFRPVVSPDQLGHERGHGVGVDRLTPAGREDVPIFGSSPGVAHAELVGGILLIAGVYSRWVALALVPVLLGAVTVHWGNGWLFTAQNGGWEYPVFLIAAALVQTLLGDGKYAAVSIARSGPPLRAARA